MSLPISDDAEDLRESVKTWLSAKDSAQRLRDIYQLAEVKDSPLQKGGAEIAWVAAGLVLAVQISEVLTAEEPQGKPIESLEQLQLSSHFYHSLQQLEDISEIESTVETLLSEITNTDHFVVRMSLGAMAAASSIGRRDAPQVPDHLASRALPACQILLRAAAVIGIDNQSCALPVDRQFIPTTLGRIFLAAHEQGPGDPALLDASIREFAAASGRATSDSLPSNVYNLGLAIRGKARQDKDQVTYLWAHDLLCNAYSTGTKIKRQQYGFELAQNALEMLTLGSIEIARRSLQTLLKVVSDFDREVVAPKLIRYAIQACVVVAVESETLQELENVRDTATRLRTVPLEQTDAAVVEFQYQAVDLAFHMFRMEWNQARRIHELLWKSGMPGARSTAANLLITCFERASRGPSENIREDDTIDDFLDYCTDLFFQLNPDDSVTFNLGVLLPWQALIHKSSRGRLESLDAVLERVRGCAPLSNSGLPRAIWRFALDADGQDFLNLVRKLRTEAGTIHSDVASLYLHFLICELILVRILEITPELRSCGIEACRQIFDAESATDAERGCALGALASLVWMQHDPVEGLVQSDIVRIQQQAQTERGPTDDVVRLAILTAVDFYEAWVQLGRAATRELISGCGNDGSNGAAIAESTWAMALLELVGMVNASSSAGVRISQEMSGLALRASEAFLDPQLREVGITFARTAIDEDPRESRARNSLARGILDRAKFVGEFDILKEAIDVCTVGLEFVDRPSVTEASLYANRGVARRLTSTLGLDRFSLQLAIANLRKAREIGSQLLAADPANDAVRSHVAGYISSLAVVLHEAATVNPDWGREALSVALEASELARGLMRAAQADLLLSRIARHSEPFDASAIDIANEALERASGATLEPSVKWQVEGERLVISATSALSSGDVQEQEESLQAVIDWIEDASWTMASTDLRTIAGRLLLALNRPAEALNMLQFASIVARSSGLAGTSEVQQTYWMRELAQISVISAGAALECDNVDIALEELARARMVLLSSPATEITAAQNELRDRNLGIGGLVGRAAFGELGSPLKVPNGKCLVIVVPGDRYGWRATITNAGHCIDIVDELASEAVDTLVRSYWQDYLDLWGAGRSVPLDVALRFDERLTALDTWMRKFILSDFEMNRIGLCLGGRLNSLPLLGLALKSRFGVTRMAVLDGEPWSSNVDQPPKGSRISVLLVAPGERQGAGSEIFNEEMQRIDNRYKSLGAVIRTDGSDISLLRAQIEKADIVHVAAHCVSDPIRPMNSWIELDETRLEAREIATWDLSGIRCIVLAACDTGMAGFVTPNEVFGFVGASLKAGASEVVAASFPIPSAATRDLMDRLHGGLARGANAADALSAAQSRPSGGHRNGITTPATLLDWAGFEVHSRLSTWLQR